MNIDLSGKVALITGAGSGMGLASAEAVLDAAYNNAGWQPPFAFIAEASTEDFDRVHAINLSGVWLSSNASSFVVGHSRVVDGGITIQ